jgi:hypothetical protein
VLPEVGCFGTIAVKTPHTLKNWDSGTYQTFSTRDNDFSEMHVLYDVGLLLAVTSVSLAEHVDFAVLVIERSPIVHFGRSFPFRIS